MNTRRYSPIGRMGFAAGFVLGMLGALVALLRSMPHVPRAGDPARELEPDEVRRRWAETRQRQRELQAMQRAARELEEEWADELEQQPLDEEAEPGPDQEETRGADYLAWKYDPTPDED